MAASKSYRTVLPIPKDQDVDWDVAQWLTRESFERTVNSDARRVSDYQWRELSERDVVALLAAEWKIPARAVPAAVVKRLGRPIADYHWRQATATGHIDDQLVDWLTAESTWRNDQLKRWVEAETAWQRTEAGDA